MSATFKTRVSGDIMIIDVSGRITMGDSSGALRETLQALIAEGRPKILLNLSGVPFMDSAGIGELVSSYVSATARQGTLKLCQLTKRIHDLLQVTRLFKVLPIYEHEEDALRSFV